MLEPGMHQQATELDRMDSLATSGLTNSMQEVELDVIVAITARLMVCSIATITIVDKTINGSSRRWG